MASVLIEWIAKIEIEAQIHVFFSNTDPVRR